MIHTLAFGIPNGPELLIILVVVVMLFGLGKLPQVAKQLGGGLRDFQKSLRGEDEEEETVAQATPPKKLEEPTPGASAPKTTTKEADVF